MVATSFLIRVHYVAFVIFVAVQISSGDDARYTVCSTSLYSCGNIKFIGYPFWSDNRPKFCGVQDLRLDCNNTSNLTSISIGLYPFQVHDISGASHMMTLSRLQQSNISCWELTYNNWALPPAFKADTSVRNLSIFYNCPKDWVIKNHPMKFNCSNPDGTQDSAYYSLEPLGNIDINQKCNYSISIPVGKSKLDEFVKKNSTLLSLLLGKFEMNYVANFTACLTCVNSGGTCGSAFKSSKFVCYCRGGPQSFKCSDSVVRVKSENRTLPLVLGLGIGGFILMVVGLMAIWYRRKLKFALSKFEAGTFSLERSGSDIDKGNVYFGVPLFSYSELQEATDNFSQSRELGDGGFGAVYYGKLRDGREVAVKRLYEKNYKRVEQFMNEVQILTCIRHQNLVSLYGCTSHRSKELLLVYEFVPNGTVADHLYGEKAKNGSLPWPRRLRIAIETASALRYLHASDIIHRDVKTNNILLDSNFSVKVADFGLSRLFPTHVTHVSTAPQGTPGYLDPEYNQCYQLTDKSDVYSFGVVLVELISSLPAVDMSRHRHEINLSHYAMTRIQRGAFGELVDPGLGFPSDSKVMQMTTAVGELAFQCLQHNKEFRPSMSKILDVLQRIESTNYGAGVQGTNLPLSSMDNDHAKLLSNRPQHPSSPNCVIGKWASKSTTPSSSK